MSQIAMWDKVQFGLQRSPKSKCGFGISEIGVSIWDIPNRDLGDRRIWATTSTLKTMIPPDNQKILSGKYESSSSTDTDGSMIIRDGFDITLPNEEHVQLEAFVSELITYII